ncbi:MAG: DUF6569 family protein [bacterium]
METVIRSYLQETRIGGRQDYKNLTVFPLLSAQAATLDYLTLDEALAANLIEITEIDAGGSVPELKLLNKSPRKVLIFDGEELVGAKQNRIVNTTIIVAGKATTVIPVSCVEAGRWSYKSARFHSEQRIMSADLRAMKARHVQESVRASGQFLSNQGAIWEGIDEKARRMKAVSPSMAMSEIYQRQVPSLQEYTARFEAVAEQVGAVFVINGKVVGLDSFGNPETFSKMSGKLLASYALDAIDWLDPAKERLQVEESQAVELLDGCKAASVESRASVGLGTDCRLGADGLTGFALVLDGQVLHLAAFSGGRKTAGSPGDSKMSRFSARRRSRL